MNDKTSKILDEKNKHIAALEEEILLWEVVSKIEREERATAAKPPTKRSRTNDRTSVLKKAHKYAGEDDPRSVFGALRVLAQSKSPPAPLLGYDIDEKSLKWDAGPDVPPKYQSEKDALAAVRRYLEKSR
jgi:hypothetical protein